MGFGPVERVLAYIFQLKNPLGIDEVNGRDILVDLASTPFRSEDSQSLGDLAIGID